MDNQKKYWCFSCDKECQIIKTIIDGEEVYQCSICKNSFVEEMEEKPAPQNTQSNINTVNNLNRINIINIPRGTNINNSINITSTNIINNNNNSNNNNRIQDEYGMDGTLLFLPSTVHCQPLNRNNAIPSMINSFGDIFSNITIPLIGNIFSSNNSNNNILSFLSNHNNDFQFNNLVNIIMSFESSMHGNPPASQRAMDNLPKIEINNDNIDNFKDITCNICLEGFQLGNILRVLECKHEFHENCIITWLKSRNTCPICRHELESNDPNYERRKHSHRENLRNFHRSNTNNNNNNNNNNGGNSGMFV
jgi:hypothetical protein